MRLDQDGFGSIRTDKAVSAQRFRGSLRGVRKGLQVALVALVLGASGCGTSEEEELQEALKRGREIVREMERDTPDLEEQLHEFNQALRDSGCGNLPTRAERTDCLVDAGFDEDFLRRGSGK